MADTLGVVTSASNRIASSLFGSQDVNLSRGGKSGILWQSSISNIYFPMLISAFLLSLLWTYRKKRKKRKPQGLVFLLGPPGCGKGTVGSLLRDRQTNRFAYLDIGALMRTDLIGLGTGNYTSQGELAPGNVVVEVLRMGMATLAADSFANERCDWLIVDGFPRSLDQLAEWMRVHKTVPDAVLYFDIPENVMRDRIFSRGREDDVNEKVLETRILKAKEQLSVLKVFKELNVPVGFIDGNQAPDAVADECINVLSGVVSAS